MKVTPLGCIFAFISDPPEHPESSGSDGDGITRRQFVGTGVAVGAAVVWTAPFADAAVGKLLFGPDATGTTGTTGSSGSAGSSSGSSGASGASGSTGTTGTTGATGGTQLGGEFQFPYFRREHDGSLAMTAFLPSPGELSVTATATYGARSATASALGRGRLKYATYTTVAQQRGLIHARLHPTKAGAALFARRRKHDHPLKVMVTAIYTPSGGVAHKLEHTIIVRV
jgi:hypothetical protein